MIISRCSSLFVGPLPRASVREPCLTFSHNIHWSSWKSPQPEIASNLRSQRQPRSWTRITLWVFVTITSMMSSSPNWGFYSDLLFIRLYVTDMSSCAVICTINGSHSAFWPFCGHSHYTIRRLIGAKRCSLTSERQLFIKRSSRVGRLHLGSLAQSCARLQPASDGKSILEESRVALTSDGWWWSPAQDVDSLDQLNEKGKEFLKTGAHYTKSCLALKLN